jgi:hypothetical protein
MEETSNCFLKWKTTSIYLEQPQRIKQPKIIKKAPAEVSALVLAMAGK